MIDLDGDKGTTGTRNFVLKVVLRRPGPVSIGRRAGGPPVELDPRVRTEAQVQGAEEARAGLLAGAPGARGLLLLLLLVGVAVLAELALEAQELLHEVEVGGYVGLAAAHEVERVVHAEVALVHEVGDGYGDRPGDPGETVDEDALVGVARLLCGQQNQKWPVIGCCWDIAGYGGLVLWEYCRLG